MDKIKDLVFFCIAKWASRNGKFDNLKVKDILHNQEATIHYTTPEIFSGGRDFEVQCWSCKGKPDPAGIKRGVCIIVKIWPCFPSMLVIWSLMRRKWWLFLRRFESLCQHHFGSL